MREAGEVIRSYDGYADVLFNRTSACGKCHACGMLSGQNSITVKAVNSLGAVAGNRVEVEFTTKNALGTSAWAYLFPLGMLFLGLILGFNLPIGADMEREVFAALMALIFVVVGFVILHAFNKVFRKKFANIYSITKIVEE